MNSKLAIFLFLLLCLSLSTAMAQYQSLCWRITGGGLTSPSYLFGTMHVADKRIFDFSKRTMQGFEDTKAFAMELDPDKALNRATLSQLMMTDGTTIRGLIADSDYHYLDSILTATTGLGMAAMNTMEPILVSTLLEELSMGIKTADSSSMSEAMDLYLYHRAQKAHKKLIGIETVEEQIAALHSLSYREQAALLTDAIHDSKSKVDSSARDLMKYYLLQDLDSIVLLSDESKMPPKFYKALVTDRNERMANRITVYLKSQPTFIAIGALHLPGPKGVIELLRRKGYSLEAWR